MSDKTPMPHSIIRNLTAASAPFMGRSSVQDLKRKAAAARAQRDWALDTFYRRKIAAWLRPSRRTGYSSATP